MKHSTKILQLLKRTYPDADCSLRYRSPLQLLVATILSAQCTDIQVNKITPALFDKYKTADDYANAPLKDIEESIKSTGFFHNKTKNIQGACQTIAEEFNGTVPDTMNELLTLPGVGRKTANVVLSNGFSKNEGFVVDTHVFRLSHRIGLAAGTTPEKVEQELMKIFPQNDWAYLSHALILHGRKYCTARKPKCSECPLAKECQKALD
jgi:endonuclease-3